MNLGDVINGLFEFCGGIFILLHIRTLLRDKDVKGVSIPATIYFVSWGIWNVWFYPANGLWWSFAGGLFIALFNTVWVILMLYYYAKNKKKLLTN